MNTQQNQNETKKKSVQVNPSRDVNYNVQRNEESTEEINPSEFDQSEVELDQTGVEFDGGEEEEEHPQPEQMSSDLGGDDSQVSEEKH